MVLYASDCPKTGIDNNKKRRKKHLLTMLFGRFFKNLKKIGPLSIRRFSKVKISPIASSVPLFTTYNLFLGSQITKTQQLIIVGFSRL
jgi:hypothetical protein